MATLKFSGIPASLFAGFVPKWVTKKEAEEIYPADKPAAHSLEQSDTPDFPDKLFTYDMRERIRTGTHLTEKHFIESIMQNNWQFTFYWDGLMNNVPVVKCKIKPRDMPIYGIYWREHTPEN